PIKATTADRLTVSWGRGLAPLYARFRKTMSFPQRAKLIKAPAKSSKKCTDSNRRRGPAGARTGRETAALLMIDSEPFACFERYAAARSDARQNGPPGDYDRARRGTDHSERPHRHHARHPGIQECSGRHGLQRRIR